MFRLPPTPLVASVLFLSLAVLAFSSTAFAKYVPPPAPSGTHHCVTEVGWLAPADIRKIDEESEIARIQTGFVIDVLLAKEAEPIDEVASETFQAWKPGDPAKDNGILLVIQPNFPQAQRKARLLVGKGVESKITAAKANEILRRVMGPMLNNGDLVRAAVADTVLEIAKTLGADESVKLVVDAGASGRAAASSEGDSEEGVGRILAIVLGGALVVALGYLAFTRLAGAPKKT